MKKAFSLLETRLQRLIEEGTARLFASEDMKSTLATRLADCMQAEVRFGSKGELLAPHIYTIKVNSQQAAALNANDYLLSELGGALKAAADHAEIHLLDDPVLHISAADDIPEGDFRVRSAGLGEALSETQSLELSTRDQEELVPSGAFLIVNGADIFPLTQGIINIGRKSDNQLVIEDQHVSRRHAQLRAISGTYHFFDLGSTGGSTINGQTIKSAALLAGDVISLAGVPLIYGQDAVPTNAETQEIEPKQTGDLTGTTADHGPTP